MTLKYKKTLRALLEVAFSFFLFFAFLELGLNLIGPIYNLSKTDKSTDKDKKLIVVLGESTSTDIATLEGNSWPKQLLSSLNKENDEFELINLAEPGTTTSALLNKLSGIIDKKTPVLIISMMGVNDSPHFWYNKYSLIKNKKGYEFKILKLARILKDFNKFFDESPAAPILSSDLSYPEIHLLLEKIKASSSEDDAYKNALKNIESFLKTKTNTEKAQFYSFIAHSIQPPWGTPTEEFKKTLEFHLLALKFNSAVDQSLEIALHLANGFKQFATCKEIVNRALDQNIHLSNVSINRLMTCLPTESDYIASVLKNLNSDFQYDPSDELPTVANYKTLFEITKSRGICWIAMEYPNQKISQKLKDLKSLDTNGSYFNLENYEQFSAALKSNSYGDIFTDKLTSNFGHLTSFGAKLISENAANKIKELKSKQLCNL